MHQFSYFRVYYVNEQETAAQNSSSELLLCRMAMRVGAHSGKYGTAAQAACKQKQQLAHPVDAEGGEAALTIPGPPPSLAAMAM